MFEIDCHKRTSASKSRAEISVLESEYVANGKCNKYLRPGTLQIEKDEEAYIRQTRSKSRSMTF